MLLKDLKLVSQSIMPVMTRFRIMWTAPNLLYCHMEASDTTLTLIYNFLHKLI